MKSTRPLKVRPGKGIDGERRRITDFDPPEVVLKDLRMNPNGRKIGNRVKARIGLDGNTWKSVAFGDVAGNRRIDFQFLLHLAGGFQSGNFLFRDPPLLEPFRGCIEQRGGARSDAWHRALRHLLLILFCHQDIRVRSPRDQGCKW